MPNNTARNRFIKPIKGEFVDTWGDEYNNGATDLIDASLDGVEAVTVSGPVTLTVANHTGDQARKRILVFTGTGGTVTIPDAEKWYWIINGCTGAVTMKPSGTGAVVPAGASRLVICSGTTAAVRNTGGLGLVQTITPTPSPTASFSLDMSVYRRFLFVLKGVSHNSGSNQQLYFNLSGTGGKNVSNLLLTAATIAGASLVSGTVELEIPAGVSGIGHIRGELAVDTTDAGVVATRGGWTAQAFASANQGIFLWSGTTPFDAGSIELWAA